jgi:signal transduction histidine kinase
MISARTERAGDEPHLGLGLYIARLIAEFHGGTITAANLPDGSGVSVRLTLPLAPG